MRKALLTTLVPLSFVPFKPAKAALTIVLSGTDVLHFGTITESGAGGTVVISTAGGRTTTGSVSAIGGLGLESNGGFQIAASTGVNITVSVTAPSFNVTDGAAGVMAINNFNIVTAAGGATQIINLGSSPATFPVGATLNVSAAQAPGTYTGTINLNAVYQ